MRTVRIDFDYFNSRKLEALKLLYNVPLPYKVRLSSSGKGLHLIKYCNDNCRNTCYECCIYTQYDDKNRLKSHTEHKRLGRTNNVLWDIKHGRSSDEWYNCNDHTDVSRSYVLYME